MAKQIKIDPDHKPLDNSPLGVREYEDGGWYQFERWAGVSWFGGHSTMKERYGTIRSDTQVPSRFPIVERDSRNGTEPKPKPKSRYE
jgi:hypothetical protein